jgi:hypothetical protein
VIDREDWATSNSGVHDLNDKERTMSKKSDESNVSRRQFLAAAGTVATAGSFAVGTNSDLAQASPNPSTPGPYRVTVVVDSNGNITYTATDGADKPVLADELETVPGDLVRWKAHIASNKYRLTIMMFFKTPLEDGASFPLYVVSGTEADGAADKIGAKIGAGASGRYKYFVRVVDHGSGKPYLDDPTIIVGRDFSAREIVEQAKGELADVRQTIKSIEGELGEALDKLKK